MGSQDLLEGFGLGLAELRESRGSMSHGTVMLTQLRAGIGIDGRRGVSVVGETGSQQRQARLGIGLLTDPWLVACDERLGAFTCECHDGFVTVRALEIRECGDCEIVIVHVEGVTPRVGEGEDARRTSPTACGSWAERAVVVRLHDALRDQGVQVPADDRRAVP